MEANDVRLICYFNGKLVDEDRDARYIGGKTKVDKIPKSIRFASFKAKIQEMTNLPLNRMGFKIKCGVRYDEVTVIGIDVDDDKSLQSVMDDSKFVRAYILEDGSSATTSTANKWQEVVLPPQADNHENELNPVLDVTEHSEMNCDNIPGVELNPQGDTRDRVYSSSFHHMYSHRLSQPSFDAGGDGINIPMGNQEDHEILETVGWEDVNINSFSQSNAVHHDEGINLSIHNHEDNMGNGINVLEDTRCEENHVTFPTEETVPPPDVDVRIQTSAYEPSLLESSDYGFALGREFPNIDALRNALSDMAIQTEREYKHGRTSPSHLSMKCSAEGCKWHIQARRMLPKSPIFKVVKYEEGHSSVVHTSTKSPDHPQATVRWILTKVKSSIEKDPNMEPSKIVDKIKDRYGILISYNKAVKAKTKALDSMRNRIQKDTCFRPEVCLALIRELEYGGTICRLGLSSDGSSFQHLFWAFRACIDALRNHLRPVVYVGKLHTEIGVLMYAQGIDGDGFDNCHPIEVGFAFCVRDDVETWEAFLGWLKEFVLPPTSAEAGNSNSNTIPFTIMSDFRETAVTRAVQTVLPRIHHFFRADILAGVFYQKFHDDNLYSLCWEACRTFSQEECESALEKINSKNKEAYEWLESVGSKCHWARAFSPNKYVVAFLVPWYYPSHLKSMVLKKNNMFEIVESSREWVARYFSQRRSSGELITTGLTRGVTDDFENARYYLPYYEVKESINGHNNKYYYQVTKKYADNDGPTWEVDLRERSCTCGKFQATQYPCRHAFKVIVHLDLDVKDYVSHKWYGLDTYLKTYEGSLPDPISVDISQWFALPLPPRRTQVGRPRKLQKI